MRLSIFSIEEEALWKSIEEKNDDDVSLWKVSNIIIPIVTIVLSLACFTVFKNKNKEVELIAYLNLILNGSIPMIALNRIGAMGIYFFKFDKNKEKEYKIKDTSFLRTKLLFLVFFVMVSTMFLYIYQVSNNPFQLSWWLILPIFFSIVAVIYSIKIGKRVYLLQEKMMENTFYQAVNEGTQQAKTHLNEKYGD